MPAVALTDHGTMFGALDFYQQANPPGSSPLSVANAMWLLERFRQNPSGQRGGKSPGVAGGKPAGYRNLCKLASIAQLQGFYYKPRIDKAVLYPPMPGGSLPCPPVSKEIFPNGSWPTRMDKAEKAALFYQKIFGEGNFFLEVQNNGIPAQEKVNHGLVELSGN
jgi:DNA polymerase-3 subunit alpha